MAPSLTKNTDNIIQTAESERTEISFLSRYLKGHSLQYHFLMLIQRIWVNDNLKLTTRYR